LKTVISIDHGNNRIKTTSCSFVSGCAESGHLPAIGGSVISYKGKEYTLSDKRLAQKNDKTGDEDFFILTLFAIARELLENPERGWNPQVKDAAQVELLVGLPTLHYKAMYQRFQRYFTDRGKNVCFSYNSQPLAVEITGATAFPQAYAAALTVYDRIKDSHIVNVVDIGGYTVDCLRLTNTRPDMGVCTSLYMGVNLLFQQINEQIRASGAQNIQESLIEAVLSDDWKVIREYAPARIELIRSQAQKFSGALLAEVAQTGLDLMENKTVFVGGGALLLKDYLNHTGKAPKAVYVDDLYANAKGYLLLHAAAKGVK
jgi:plasmid segregation protein ParM